MSGAEKTGKTYLTKLFLKQQQYKQYIPTLGYDIVNVTKNIDLIYREQQIQLSLWDMQGSEQYDSIIQAYYANAQAVILVFNCNDRKSFDKCNTYMNHVKTFCIDVQVALVGNSFSDEINREVSYDEAVDFASLHDTIYVEITSQNSSYATIDNIISKLINMIIK
ncbi:Rab11 [Hexamita inflata]|uniref:Rab11 n=1 Tax=Hexamita inflata TaxID=28002 RepID=A0AA86V719_9EUKA|nr:Rab11 [Hexamita inflata]